MEMFQVHIVIFYIDEIKVLKKSNDIRILTYICEMPRKGVKDIKTFLKGSLI